MTATLAIVDRLVNVAYPKGKLPRADFLAMYARRVSDSVPTAWRSTVNSVKR